MFQFPNSPLDGDIYTSGAASYVYDAADMVWRKEATVADKYVELTGDTMSGALSLPLAAPTVPENATTKSYVDASIAASALYQGPWQVAANVPDLDPAVANPGHTFSWIAQTVDVNIPETAPAGLPGIGGLLIYASDNIVWNANTAVYDIIRAPASMAGYLPLVGGTMTGLLNIDLTGSQALNVRSAAGIKTISLNASASPHAGIIEFWDPTDGVARRGYIGYGTANNATAANNYLNINPEGGKVHINAGGLAMQDGAGIHWGNTSAQTDPLVMNEGICLYGWGTTSKFGFSITSGTLNYVVENTGNLHCFRVGSASKVTISNANGLWTEAGVPAKFHGPTNFEAGSHLLMDNTIIYSQRSTYDGSSMQHFRHNASDVTQIRGYGTSAEGGVRFHCKNGGYGWCDNWRSAVVSGGGIYVGGDCSAGSLTDRGTAATKSDIRACTAIETAAAFAALEPRRFRKVFPHPVDENGQPLPEGERWYDNRLRFGFVADDLYANESTKDIVTLAVIPDTNGQQEIVGTDIMQVLALTVAKIKLLEADIAALKRRR